MIKEKPLIDSTSRLGATPGWFFSHPVIAGFIAMVLCAMFGALMMLFQAGGRGADIYEVIELTWFGSNAAMALGGVVFTGIGISALFDRDEAPNRLLYVLGGVLGALFMVVIGAVLAVGAIHYVDHHGSIG